MSLRNINLLAFVVLALRLSVGCAEGGVAVGDSEIASAHQEVSTVSFGQWSEFVGKTNHYGSCDQYCAEINKVCANTCTTSRGFPNWGVEAWVAGQELVCGSVGAGQQFCPFQWDDVVGAANRWKCCCQFSAAPTGAL